MKARFFLSLAFAAIVLTGCSLGVDRFQATSDGVTYDMEVVVPLTNFVRIASVTTSEPLSGEVVISPTVKYGRTTYVVSQIGKGAFRDFSLLTSVTLPSTVSVIEEKAFVGCTSPRGNQYASAAFHHWCLCLRRMCFSGGFQFAGFHSDAWRRVFPRLFVARERHVPDLSEPHSSYGVSGLHLSWQHFHRQHGAHHRREGLCGLHGCCQLCLYDPNTACNVRQYVRGNESRNPCDRADGLCGAILRRRWMALLRQLPRAVLTVSK